MKRWMPALISLGIFILIIAVLNIAIIKEKAGVSDKRFIAGERDKESSLKSGLPALQVGRRVENSGREEKDKKKIIELPGIEIEPFQLNSEEEIREAEAKGIKPTEEEMRELEKSNVVFY
ncbi:MAG: hypothetical protein COV72_05070 [Candidatus Omnitrophica bacterium CG11_big_fil_rev_8_21_14_0_20_42_13]|uniref:Uncharacterized protein n=1 Tax=Candidatus Ghiorseimicrobium undicola TaxID=1974746 RepID=A0A2H0LZV7_9BACT|nr:MAG: hypothetical protein COV72_05070 [Candidatus Omnitrophica bacterium CG11_big_fil_rev_8_21_14_0_20_42_13]